MPPTVTGECEDTTAAWGAVCQTCGHTLPLPLPWDYGRPCAKSTLERGRGWDGREAPQHTEGERERWARSTPGRPIRVNPRTPVGGWDTQP